ncbi:MAG: lipoyl(octanoyl) transferase LipB [Bacillota bacterium]
MIVKKMFSADYKKTWELMEDIASRKKQGQDQNDYLLLVEHTPVYTIGKDGSREDILVPEKFLQKLDIKCYDVNRGGKITFHGPGQLVGYPILDLRNYGRDLLLYLNNIEQSIIDLLSGYGIQSSRVDGKPGVWINDDKIAAVGIGASRWVTEHGFALNVTTDLDFFSFINPCGFIDKGVSSIEKVSGKSLKLQEVMEDYIKVFSGLFKIKKIEQGEFDYGSEYKSCHQK